MASQVVVPAPPNEVLRVCRRDGHAIPWKHYVLDEIPLNDLAPEARGRMDDLVVVCTVEIKPTNVIDSTKRLWKSEECPHGIVYFFHEDWR